MKFVYRTKLGGAVEPPPLDSYRNFAIKLAALCPSRTSFKGSFIKGPFRETLGILRRAGANAIERSTGSAVEPAANKENAYRILFAKELAGLEGMLSDRNFNEGNDRGPGSLLDIVFSGDDLFLNSKVNESALVAVAAASVLKGNSRRIILEVPPEDQNLLKNGIEALNSLGAGVTMPSSAEILVEGGKTFTGGNTILPAVDWRIAVPALCFSAIGFEVTVKDTFLASPFAAKKEFTDIIERMGLTLSEDPDGNTGFLPGIKTPLRIDAAACGDYLPYLLFIATQTDGVSEIYNITEDILESNHRAFYYAVAELKKMGAEFTSQTKGSMFIIGRSAFEGGVRIDCRNCLELSMIAVLASSCSQKANAVVNCEVIETVCPDFWKNYKSIGGYFES